MGPAKLVLRFSCCRMGGVWFKPYIGGLAKLCATEKKDTDGRQHSQEKKDDCKGRIKRKPYDAKQVEFFPRGQVWCVVCLYIIGWYRPKILRDPGYTPSVLLLNGLLSLPWAHQVSKLNDPKARPFRFNSQDNMLTVYSAWALLYTVYYGPALCFLYLPNMHAVPDSIRLVDLGGAHSIVYDATIDPASSLFNHNHRETRPIQPASQSISRPPEAARPRYI